ncbi:MAG: hypothetical protein JW819_07765 [Candidatus Krumholzibacteriota bacterium]|jgi:hypothetical protein|nr:hypothetical protein [Candidatus Krumholzibacteriota bacterium]
MRNADLAPGDEARKQLVMAIVAWIRGDSLEQLCWRTGLEEDDARRAIRCFFAGALDGLADVISSSRPLRAPSPAEVLPLFTAAGRLRSGR